MATRSQGDEHPIVSALGCLLVVVIVTAFLTAAGLSGLIPPGP